MIMYIYICVYMLCIYIYMCVYMLCIYIYIYMCISKIKLFHQDTSPAPLHPFPSAPGPVYQDVLRLQVPGIDFEAGQSIEIFSQKKFGTLE